MVKRPESERPGFQLQLYRLPPRDLREAIYVPAPQFSPMKNEDTTSTSFSASVHRAKDDHGARHRAPAPRAPNTDFAEEAQFDSGHGIASRIMPWHSCWANPEIPAAPGLPRRRLERLPGKLGPSPQRQLEDAPRDPGPGSREASQAASPARGKASAACVFRAQTCPPSCSSHASLGEDQRGLR